MKQILIIQWMRNLRNIIYVHDYGERKLPRIVQLTQIIAFTILTKTAHQWFL